MCVFPYKITLTIVCVLSVEMVCVFPKSSSAMGSPTVRYEFFFKDLILILIFFVSNDNIRKRKNIKTSSQKVEKTHKEERHI